MEAELTRVYTRNGVLPGLVTFHGRRRYHEDDIDRIIVAHREDDGDVFGLDFICPDEEEAWKELRALADRMFPGYEIIDHRD